MRHEYTDAAGDTYIVHWWMEAGEITLGAGHLKHRAGGLVPSLRVSMLLTDAFNRALRSYSGSLLTMVTDDINRAISRGVAS